MFQVKDYFFNYVFNHEERQDANVLINKNNNKYREGKLFLKKSLNGKLSATLGIAAITGCVELWRQEKNWIVPFIRKELRHPWWLVSANLLVRGTAGEPARLPHFSLWCSDLQGPTKGSG